MRKVAEHEILEARNLLYNVQADAGVDLGDDDQVRLIEHETRYGQAAAAQKS